MQSEAPGRRPTKLVLVALGLFVLSVFLGRLLVTGGGAWIVFALALPVALLLLSRLAGWGGSFLLTGAFALAVLAARWFVQANPAGWAALLLLPVVALTGLIVGRVLAKLREPRAAQTEEASAKDTQGPS